MPRLSFTLRDVFWLTLVVGMGVGWWIERGQRARFERQFQLADDRVKSLFLILDQDGYKYEAPQGRLGPLKFPSTNEVKELRAAGKMRDPK